MKIHFMYLPNHSAERDASLQQWLSSEHEICVHADPERHGVLWNHRTIVDCIEREAKDLGNPRAWSLVVQDDAIALPGWEDEYAAATFFSPAPFLSLCHFGAYGLRLVSRGIPYGVGVNATWGQAVAYRHDVIRSYAQLVRDVQEMDAERYRKWDDGLTAVHNLLHGSRSALTSRALFQHADQVASTMGHARGRHAEMTIEQPGGPQWGAAKRFASVGHTEDVQKECAQRLLAWRANR